MPGFELVGAEERDAVMQVFEDGGCLFAHGFDAMRKGRYRVREFEAAFAKTMGCRYAQAVNTGTSALKVALFALGVKAGDEVITQAFNFVATVEAIVDLGATPILVNVDDTLNMNPAELKKAITPKTKAILPVHMLGVAARLDEILAVAGDIPVLEDNCEALGARWGEGYLGLAGQACAISLDFGKTITTGEGGMILTDDEDVFQRAREYHDHGHQNDPSLPRGRDTRRFGGFNYRMTELQGAVGLAQLPKLEQVVKRNHEVCALFKQALENIPGLVFRAIPEKCTPLDDCLIFELPDAKTAAEFVKKMGEAKLGTKNVPDAIEWHFAGYWDHIFANYGFTKDSLWQHTLPSWRRLERCVAIPVLVKMTDERAHEIAAQLRSIAGACLGAQV